MQVIKVYPLGFAANTYFITQNGKDAVVIDPAQPRVIEEAKRRGLNVRYALLTHGHFDHIGGCAALQRAGAKIGCLKQEEQLVTGSGNCADLFGVEIEFFRPDFTFSDGETLSLCGVNFKVIATPGHTAGGACYVAENALFTGDTLFFGSVGRCDLPTGNGALLTQSVKKLYALAGDYTIYAGHDEDTTLSYEREHNGAVRA